MVGHDNDDVMANSAPVLGEKGELDFQISPLLTRLANNPFFEYKNWTGIDSKIPSDTFAKVGHDNDNVMANSALELGDKGEFHFQTSIFFL